MLKENCIIFAITIINHKKNIEKESLSKTTDYKCTYVPSYIFFHYQYNSLSQMLFFYVDDFMLSCEQQNKNDESIKNTKAKTKTRSQKLVQKKFLLFTL